MAPKKAARKRRTSADQSLETAAKRHNGDNSTASTTDITRLPDLVLKRVIQFVLKTEWPKLESVNHAFQRATHMAWGSVREIQLGVDFIFNRKALKNDHMNVLHGCLWKLLHRAPKITSISGFSEAGFIYQERLNNDLISLLVEFDHLESIRFGCIDMTYMQLAQFLHATNSRRKLKVLDMNNTSDHHDDADITVLRSAFGDRPDLPPLRLEEFTCYKRERHSTIFGSLRFIGNIDATCLTVLRLQYIPDGQEILISLINRCIKLHHLEFSINGENKDLDFNRCGLDKRLLQAIAASPSDSLSILEIGWYDGIYPDTYDFNTALVDFITRLGRRRNPLSEFSLLVALRTDDGFKAIGNHLQHLTALALDIRYCSPEMLHELLIKLERLEKLKLREIRSIDVLNKVAASKSLKYLDMTGDLDTDDDVIDVLNQLDQLKGLRLGGDSSLVMDVLGYGYGPLIPNLESLELADIDYPSKFIAPALKRLPQLRRLDLKKSIISDIILTTVAKWCPLLRELDIHASSNFTRNGIQAVIDGCTNLEKIRLFKRSRPALEKWYRGLGVNKHKVRFC